jgi:1,4-alpha-glucan branching enzyme
LPALHDNDFEPGGFEWIDCHDAEQSVLLFERRARDGSSVLVALNFTPVVRHGYRVGVSEAGVYREIFNSDSVYYGGGNVGNGRVKAQPAPWMGRPCCIDIALPPLAGIVLRREA